MNKNILALIVIFLCIGCLGLGYINAYNNKDVITQDSSEGGKKNKNIISTDAKVGVIDLQGVIENSAKSELFSMDYSASNALKSLRSAVDDNSVKGIILRINSPGGTVAMSQNINEEVMRVRANKPVIVLIEDMAASGGYYIACAGDRIIAKEGSLTGSIGVIFSTFDLHKLMQDKLFINSNVIKSGRFKDIGSSYREMTNDEKTLLQDIVDDSYEQFISAIVNGRVNRDDKYTAEKTHLTENKLREIADGRIFTGSQAKKLGLVDITGGINKAEEVMQTMVNEKFNSKTKIKLVNYNKKSSLNEYLFGVTESLFNRNLEVSSLLPVSMRLTKRPLYLWE
ncbi:signal peptide peptidase SppA [bacterium]|nr:signal peptide peptidase SppA [bacterium]